MIPDVDDVAPVLRTAASVSPICHHPNASDQSMHSDKVVFIKGWNNMHHFSKVASLSLGNFSTP